MDVNSNSVEIPIEVIIRKEDEATARNPRITNIDEDDEDQPETVTIEDENEVEEPVGELESERNRNNSYTAKKTVAQGMMDIALITANANQLRFLTEFTKHNTVTFYVNVTLIVISLLLQVAIGVCLVFKGRLDFKGMSRKKTAKVINNYVVMAVFLVTIINVFIASFTVGERSSEDGQKTH